MTEHIGFVDDQTYVVNGVAHISLVEYVLNFFKKATMLTKIRNKKVTQLYSLVYSKQNKHYAASNNDIMIS